MAIISQYKITKSYKYTWRVLREGEEKHSLLILDTVAKGEQIVTFSCSFRAVLVLYACNIRDIR